MDIHGHRWISTEIDRYLRWPWTWMLIDVLVDSQISIEISGTAFWVANYDERKPKNESGLNYVRTNIREQAASFFLC